MKNTDKAKVLDQKKDRKFTIRLYPDSQDYNAKEVIDSLLQMYDVAYILHDKDRYEEDGTHKEKQKDGTVIETSYKKGDLKKPHYHIIVRWTNGSARYRSGLAKELQIDKCNIEPVSKLDEMLMYLVHFKENEKYQYSTDEVYGTPILLERLVELVNDSQDGREEGEKAMDLMNYINEYDGYLSTSDFFRYVIITKQMGTYKKYYHTFHRIIDEHNGREFSRRG